MTIKEFIKEFSYKELQGKRIRITPARNSIIVYIRNNFFTQNECDNHRWIEERIKNGGNPCFRLYGGLTQDADDVYWITPNSEVLI